MGRNSVDNDIMWVCDVNRHQGSWEGRTSLKSLEPLNSVELARRQDEGKNRAILSKGRNASCPKRAGPTRRNLKEFLISCVTANCVCSENIYMLFMVCVFLLTKER